MLFVRLTAVLLLSGLLLGCEEEFGVSGVSSGLNSLPYARNVGATWVRVFVKWIYIEPSTPSNDDVQARAQIVATLAL